MNYRDALISSGVDAPTADIFIAYHKHHPQVWQKFSDKACMLKANGITRYGAKAIMEVIRFEETLARGADGFKVNNSYAAYYARIWMLKYKDADFFETRETEGLRA